MRRKPQEKQHHSWIGIEVKRKYFVSEEEQREAEYEHDLDEAFEEGRSQ